MRIVINSKPNGQWHWVASGNGKLAQGSSNSLLACLMRAYHELADARQIEHEATPAINDSDTDRPDR